jgi:streptogrisin D
VVNYGYITPGQHVCVSGSFTGAVCNLFNTRQIAAGYCTTDRYARTYCVRDLVQAVQRYGQRACDFGDSGAPVFDLVGPAYFNVVARGIISACNAAFGGDYVYYAKFTDAMSDFGYVVPLVAF